MHDDDEYANSQIVRVPVEKGSLDDYEIVLAENKDSMIQQMILTEFYMVLVEMSNCKKTIRIAPFKESKADLTLSFYVDWKALGFNEEIFTFFFESDIEHKSTSFKLRYMSAINPPKVIEYDMDKREWTVLHSQELGNYDKSLYKTERRYARSHDGKEIPITMTYRKDKIKEGVPSPVLLFGYGAYWSAQQTWFMNSSLAIYDQGFIFAIAHVRGGVEKGRKWAINGQRQNKLNSFKDYISCAEYLIKTNVTSSDILTGWGKIYKDQ
jgi:oligopeptidase B